MSFTVLLLLMGKGVLKKIFISYAREDRETARKLYKVLKKAGLEPWMDKANLVAGQNWKYEISQAIKKSDYLIALLSSESVSKRGFVQKEFNHALEVLGEIPPGEIYIIPVRLDDCDVPYEKLHDIHWADLFPDYNEGLREVLRAFGINAKIREPVKKTKQAEPQKPVTDDSTDSVAVKETKQAETPKAKSPETAKPEVKPEAESVPGEVYMLRSEPKTLSEDDVKAMLAKHNFFASNWNKSGSFRNDFKDNGDTITDSVTGLMWEKSGSSNYMLFKDAQGYIQGLNQKKFAGFDDWRLPTLEELASLLESEEVDDLFIDPLFDRKQWGCWTSDKYASGVAWRVLFHLGVVGWRYFSYGFYVCAVRSRTI